MNLIEKLEALPEYWSSDIGDAIVKLNDLRAIIEQAKAAQEKDNLSKSEPVAWRYRNTEKGEFQYMTFYPTGCEDLSPYDVVPLYQVPQPDHTALIRELVEALETIGQRFVSGNDVPVSRAIVPAEEWANVDALLTKARETIK